MKFIIISSLLMIGALVAPFTNGVPVPKARRGGHSEEVVAVASGLSQLVRAEHGGGTSRESKSKELVEKPELKKIAGTKTSGEKIEVVKISSKEAKSGEKEVGKENFKEKIEKEKEKLVHSIFGGLSSKEHEGKKKAPAPAKTEGEKIEIVLDVTSKEAKSESDEHKAIKDNSHEAHAKKKFHPAAAPPKKEEVKVVESKKPTKDGNIEIVLDILSKEAISGERHKG